MVSAGGECANVERMPKYELSVFKIPQYVMKPSAISFLNHGEGDT